MKPGVKLMNRSIDKIAISWLLLLPCLGCAEPGNSDTIPPATAPASPDTPSTGASSTVTGRATPGPDDILAVKDGGIHEGRPKVTENVEREIYKSLNHRRKMMASIKRNSGPNRGIQQMQDELALLTRGFMSRYSLTQQEIDEILKKGDSNAWE